MAESIIKDFVPVRFDLGQAVSTALETFTKERSRLQAVADGAFYEAVAKGMTYQDQAAYRRSQLQAEQNRAVPDPDYIVSLKKEISTLDQQGRYEKIRNAYKDELGKAVGGLESWQQALFDLKDMLVNEQDPAMQSELRSQIQEAQRQVLSSRLQLISNETSTAVADKSLPLLQKALDDASKEKATALGANDQVRASLMDDKIVAIQQSMVDIKIGNENNALTLNRARKASAVGYLQMLQTQVGSSDSTTPIIYQGIRYDSEAQYWQLQSNKYIESNFFSDLTSEYGKFTKSVGDVSGLIPNSVMDNIQGDFSQLSQRPDMQPYLNRLQVTGNSILAEAVKITASAIRDRYTTTEDFQTAITDLQGLQQKYGIDTTADINQVVQAQAKIKGQDFANVLGAIQNLVATHGISFQEASAQVLGNMGTKGSGGVQNPKVSPQDLATKPINELVKNAPQETDQNIGKTVPVPAAQPDVNKGANVETPSQSVGLTTSSTPNNAPAKPTPGTPAAAAPGPLPANQTPPGGRTYVVKAGDTLSGIAHQLYGDRTAYQKIFDANKDVLNNPSLIKTGQTLKIPDQNQPVK